MRPGPLLYVLLSAWLLVGVGVSVWPVALPLWVGVGGLIAAAVGLEAVRLRRLPVPLVERELSPSLALGAANEVTLTLRSLEGAPATQRLEVFDHHPPTCTVEGQPRAVTLPAGGFVQVPYRLTPTVRGKVMFGQTALVQDGPWRLLRRHVLSGEAQEVRVYPNFQEVVRYVLLALADRVGQMGIRLQRRRGEGLEFEQLRDYRDGDLIRQIDWKATARRGRLISREYQDEKNQQIVFLLDCGRRMRTKDADLSHFDHVLNALLLLTYIGVRQGDAVGFMTFSGQRRWLPPQKGPAGMNRILDAIYDLQTTTAPSDYAEAARRLMTRQKRRALVILVSNLRDEDERELAPALATLRRRNLVLLASLREHALVEASEAAVDSFPDALRLAESRRLLLERRRVHEAARRGGSLVIDVAPRELPVTLVNRYLDIKRSGRL